MPQIVEPEPRQARFLRQRPPCRPPAFHVPRRVKSCDVVIHYSLAAEGKLGNEASKDVMRRLDRAEAFRSPAQPRSTASQVTAMASIPMQVSSPTGQATSSARPPAMGKHILVLSTS